MKAPMHRFILHKCVRACCAIRRQEPAVYNVYMLLCFQYASLSFSVKACVSVNDFKVTCLGDLEGGVSWNHDGSLAFGVFGIRGAVSKRWKACVYCVVRR